MEWISECSEYSAKIVEMGVDSGVARRKRHVAKARSVGLNHDRFTSTRCNAATSSLIFDG